MRTGRRTGGALDDAAYNGNGLAPWVKAVTTLGATGASIVIAVFLVYSLVSLDRERRGGGGRPRLRARRAAPHAGGIEVHVQQADRSTDALKAILRQICVNTAEGASQRTACFTRVE